MPTKPYYLAASIVCADMLHIADQVALLDKGKADYIHFDVMDGLFVPRFGLHPEMLQAIRSVTKIPIDVHMMVENPEPYIGAFAEAGADIIAVHAESTRHLHRTLTLIKKAGVKAGVALNPATPLDVLDFILDDIDLVVFMAINPGIVGHKLIPKAMEKIEDIRAKLKDHPHILLQVDGGVTPETAPKMLKAGANMLVCGSSTIFRPEAPVDQKLQELRTALNASL